MLPKKTKFCNFGKFMEMFCVCARLYCRKCTLSFFVFVFVFSKCAVLGDSVEVLEK